MRTPRGILVAAAVAAVVAPLAMAPSQATAANTDTRVSIVATEDFVTGTGSFEASGAGLCSSGTTSQPDGVTVIERRRTLTFVLDKVFTCDDGSGSFTMQLRAWWLPCAPSNRGVWTIIAGTGDYASLRGSGQQVGTYFPAACEDGGVEDVYTGHASS
jgi:hypothetical protein